MYLQLFFGSICKLKYIGITEEYTSCEIVWNLSGKEKESHSTVLALRVFVFQIKVDFSLETHVGEYNVYCQMLLYSGKLLGNRFMYKKIQFFQ